MAWDISRRSCILISSNQLNRAPSLFRSLTKSATRLSKVRAGYYLTIPKLLQLQQYQFFNAIRVRHSVNRGGNCEFTYDSLRAVPDKIICAKFLPCWSKDHWLQVECASPSVEVGQFTSDTSPLVFNHDNNIRVSTPRLDSSKHCH